jgi:hypothetical protein
VEELECLKCGKCKSLSISFPLWEKKIVTWFISEDNLSYELPFSVWKKVCNK